MMSRLWTVIPLLASAAGLAGCGGGPRPAATLPGGDQTQAVSGADTTPAMPAVAASASQAPANLAGSWALRAEDRTRRGPLLELAMDSVTGSTFRVRVAFVMQGNVGIEPSLFEPTQGRADADGTLHLTVKTRTQAEPMGEMSGTLSGDTIRLRTYRWAGEDQTAGGTRWLLVRQP